MPNTGKRLDSSSTIILGGQFSQNMLKCSVALIADLTSNVFSTAITVAVKTEDVELFKEWLDSDFEELQEALT